MRWWLTKSSSTLPQCFVWSSFEISSWFWKQRSQAAACQFRQTVCQYLHQAPRYWMSTYWLSHLDRTHRTVCERSTQVLSVCVARVCVWGKRIFRPHPSQRRGLCENIDRNNKVISDVFFLQTSPYSQNTHTHTIIGYATAVLMMQKLAKPRADRR